MLRNVYYCTWYTVVDMLSNLDDGHCTVVAERSYKENLWFVRDNMTMNPGSVQQVEPLIYCIDKLSCSLDVLRVEWGMRIKCWKLWFNVIAFSHYFNTWQIPVLQVWVMSMVHIVAQGAKWCIIVFHISISYDIYLLTHSLVMGSACKESNLLPFAS